METDYVTLENIIKAAAARAASLTPETAGYLVLSASEVTGSHPYPFDGIVVHENGTVALLTPRIPARGPEPALFPQAMLRRLLDVSVGGMPALLLASRDCEGASHQRFISQLEAGLIPMNWSAARRAIGRLARETARHVAEQRSLPERAATQDLETRAAAQGHSEPKQSSDPTLDIHVEIEEEAIVEGTPTLVQTRYEVAPCRPVRVIDELELPDTDGCGDEAHVPPEELTLPWPVGLGMPQSPSAELREGRHSQAQREPYRDPNVTDRVRVLASKFTSQEDAESLNNAAKSLRTIFEP